MVHVPKGVLGWLLLLSHKNCMILEQRWNCIHITEDLFIIIYGDGIMQSDCPFQRTSDESVNSPARDAFSDSRSGLAERKLRGHRQVARILLFPGARGITRDDESFRATRTQKYLRRGGVSETKIRFIGRVQKVDPSRYSS